MTASSEENRRRLSCCLSVDLEVAVRDRRIRAFAGVRGETGRSFLFPGTGNRLPQALAKLDDLATGADFLLGHNLIDFDLPHLRSVNLELKLLDLPAVDTLRLNPLAFPRNPYHHLVKHYQGGQLKRGRINDPELDARLTLEVFDNQLSSLSASSQRPLDGLALAHVSEGRARIRSCFQLSSQLAQTDKCRGAGSH